MRPDFEPQHTSEEELILLKHSFRVFGRIHGHTLEFEAPPLPAVYVATLNGFVFWVGQTDNLRDRFKKHKVWFALPDNSNRRDKKARDDFLKLVDEYCASPRTNRRLVLWWKPPIEIRSPYEDQSFPGHRVEETMLIRLFEPPWNLRPGGRARG